MPSGCVIEYRGKRGVTYRAKYRDSDGQQVMETIGREADGWTQKKAERALGPKLAEVERGMRRPTRRTFGDLLDEFEAIALASKPRKKSTLVDYRATIRNHLRPRFGAEDVGALSRSPEAFERYAADKLKEGLSAKTVRNQLVLLGLIFKTARRWRWVQENPLERLPHRRSRMPTHRRSAPLTWLLCFVPTASSRLVPKTTSATGMPLHDA